MKKSLLLLLLCACLLLPACAALTAPESAQPEPEYVQPEAEAQAERAEQAAQTWRDVQVQFPDVSAMSGFPVAEEAWHPEPIVVHGGEAEYWIDRSESWENARICMRKDGQTASIYAAQDGSLSQLAVFDGMLYFAQTGGIYRMPTEGGAAELWIPDGGRFALAGGVIYTWLSEQGFCAIAAQDPEQAVPVWKQEQALTVRQTVPVTGGIVFWLAENEPDPDAGQLWVVLLRNSGQWELLREETGPMPRSIFSDDTNVWFMRETSEGQFLYQIDCKDGAYACLGKLPEAPDGCYSPGTPVLGFQRLLMRYQGIESTMEFYALDDKLTLGEHLLSYGADDSYAIYFLHLFEIQETPQSFYFCGRSEENGLYLVSEIRKSGDWLLQEEVLQPPAFRAAVYQAFSAGILPLEGNKTERTVTICLTGDAAQPFLFMECN